MDSKRWYSDELNVSQTLVDFILLLIRHAEQQQTKEGEENGITEEYGRKGEETLLQHCGSRLGEDEDVSSEWTKPLFVLRDRALDMTHDYDAMDDYLGLIRTLLSSISSSSPSSSSSSMKPSVAIGLTSLSSLCTSPEMATIASKTQQHQQQSKQIQIISNVRKVIVDSFDDLSDIMESVQPKTTSANMTEEENISTTTETPSWIHVSIRYLPIFDFMTNTKSRFDYAPFFDTVTTSTKNSMNNREAQSLLNSGELILLFTKTRPSSSSSSPHPKQSLPPSKMMTMTAQTVIRTQIARTIFTLCAQSTNLLAKYATRVPDLTREVYGGGYKDENLVDATLWSILGSSLLQNSPSSRLKMPTKTKNKTMAKKNTEPTLDDLLYQSFNYFMDICNKVQASLAGKMSMNYDDKKKKENENEDETANEPYAKEEDALLEYIRFTNCITNCHGFATAWCQSLSSSSSNITNKQVQSKQCLVGIMSSLSKVSSAIAAQKKREELSSSREVTKSKGDDNKTGDSNGGEEDDEKKKNHSQDDEVLASVRKGTKMLLLLLDNNDDVNKVHSSKGTTAAALSSMSSKTD